MTAAGVWIPAFAGMTGLTNAAQYQKPSNYSRHNYIIIPAICHHPAPTVIPAKAGIHTPACRYAGIYRGSGFRPAPE